MSQASPAEPRVGLVAEARVITNVVTAYMKVRFTLTTQRLSIAWPATVLGVVPVRRQELDVPLGAVADVRMAAAFFPARLAVALAVVALLFSSDLPALGVGLLGLLATLFVLLSYVATVRVVLADGTRRVVPVCWLRRHRVRSFVAAAQRLVHGDTPQGGPTGGAG